MGKYQVIIKKSAEEDFSQFKKAGNKANIKKILTILAELTIHPTTGTGQPEQLKFQLSGLWSRRINKKDRMIYEIDDTTVTVYVLSAIGHYLDK